MEWCISNAITILWNDAVAIRWSYGNIITKFELMFFFWKFYWLCRPRDSTMWLWSKDLDGTHNALKTSFVQMFVGLMTRHVLKSSMRKSVTFYRKPFTWRHRLLWHHSIHLRRQTFIHSFSHSFFSLFFLHSSRIFPSFASSFENAEYRNSFSPLLVLVGVGKGSGHGRNTDGGTREALHAQNNDICLIFSTLLASEKEAATAGTLMEALTKHCALRLMKYVSFWIYLN